MVGYKNERYLQLVGGQPVSMIIANLYSGSFDSCSDDTFYRSSFFIEVCGKIW